jgi:hypothetical protein
MGRRDVRIGPYEVAPFRSSSNGTSLVRFQAVNQTLAYLLGVAEDE